MSVVTIRANQTAYSFNEAGGTRDPNYEVRDAVTFMDAVERQDATILDDTKKGAAMNTQRPRWGVYSVTPRGSVVGSGGISDVATDLPLPVGHSPRFQQGHVLQLTRASDNETETLWVSAEPLQASLTVTRGKGGTTPIAFIAGDKIRIIGIAMPEASDFPLGPVSTGHEYNNEWQKFETSLTWSHEAQHMPSVDSPKGGMASRQKLQKAKDLKLDLDRALLLGRREFGSPNPAAPSPRFMGGLLEAAEQSGNVYSVGGPTTLIGPEVLQFVQYDLYDRVGGNAPKTYVMSFNTAMIFGQLFAPARYNAGISGTNYDMRWETIDTLVGKIKFTYKLDFPDGVILIYDNADFKYHPFEGMDWKEKTVPTKGFYDWWGLGGMYTTIASKIPAMAIIRDFDTNINHYPSFNRPSTFLV